MPGTQAGPAGLPLGWGTLVPAGRSLIQALLCFSALGGPGPGAFAQASSGLGALAHGSGSGLWGAPGLGVSVPIAPGRASCPDVMEDLRVFV